MTDDEKQAAEQQPHGKFPQDTSRALPIALLRAREALMAHFRPILARHELTEQQWRVMRILAESGPLDAAQLAKDAFLLPPSLTRIMRTLDGRGILNVGPDPGDGRRILAEITADGRRLIELVVPESEEIYIRLEDHLDRFRLEALLDSLQELAGFAPGSEQGSLHQFGKRQGQPGKEDQ